MQNCRTAPYKIVSTDRQTNGHPWQFQYTPFHFIVGSIIKQQLTAFAFCDITIPWTYLQKDTDKQIDRQMETLIPSYSPKYWWDY